MFFLYALIALEEMLILSDVVLVDCFSSTNYILNMFCGIVLNLN